VIGGLLLLLLLGLFDVVVMVVWLEVVDSGGQWWSL